MKLNEKMEFGREIDFSGMGVVEQTKLLTRIIKNLEKYFQTHDRSYLDNIDLELEPLRRAKHPI